jgi:hypothetical protein
LQNGFIESFNACRRDELLDADIFTQLSASDATPAGRRCPLRVLASASRTEQVGARFTSVGLPAMLEFVERADQNMIGARGSWPGLVHDLVPWAGEGRPTTFVGAGNSGSITLRQGKGGEDA